MRSTVIGLSIFVIACGPAFCQEFEVASVKPATPQDGGRVFRGRQGGPGTPDPGRVTYTNTSLKNLITMAYDLKPYQVTGPDWLESERFDITAKIPPRTTKEQANVMMQNLLVNRFQLTFHKVTKEFSLYELVAGKNGHKLKAAVEDPGPAPAGPDAGPGQGEPPHINKEGFPVLLPGRRGMWMMGSGSTLHIAGGVQTMADLANTLANQIGTPVVDKTGLSGTYDFTLEFAPDQVGRTNSGNFDGPTVFSAVQEQLGLKLESKKGPLDVMVIDRMERRPSEN